MIFHHLTLPSHAIILPTCRCFPPRQRLSSTLQCSEHRSVLRLLLTHQPRHSALSLTLSSLDR